MYRVSQKEVPPTFEKSLKKSGCVMVKIFIWLEYLENGIFKQSHFFTVHQKYNTLSCHINILIIIHSDFFNDFSKVGGTSFWLTLYTLRGRGGQKNVDAPNDKFYRPPPPSPNHLWMIPSTVVCLEWSVE